MRGGPAGDRQALAPATCRASAGAASPTGRCRRSAGWRWSRWRRGWRSGRRRPRVRSRPRPTSPAPGSGATTRRCTRCSTTRRAQAHSLREFERAYRDAAATATATAIAAGDPGGEQDGSVDVPIDVRTRVFGTVAADLLLPVSEAGVTWGPLLAFPGLRRGEALDRRSEPPERAALLSRDRKVLAEGPAGARSSPLEAIAGSIAGTLEPEETREERTALYARGFPRDWPVGQNGLEHAFEDRLAGRPGGELLAGRAGARPRPPEAREAGAHHDRHAPPGGGRDRPGRAASAASPRSTPATGRSARWPGSRSRPRSRRARPSRS